MCAFDFVDGAGDVWVLDKCFIGGIVEDDGVVSFCVVNPCCELFAGG